MTDLAPFSFSGRFWRGNLHTHSNLSDGRLPPDKVVEAYKDAGYDFMMLSDHFLDRYGWPMADTRGMRSNRFTTIIGAELHAPETAVGELWHIVAAGLPLDFPPCPPDESGPALAERAAAAGAFVGIAHPAWSQLTLADGRALAAAHAVEIYNNGCAVETDRGEGWYLYDQLLNDGARLSAFATDDAHFKVVARIGIGPIRATFGIDVTRGEQREPDYAELAGTGKAPGSAVDGTARMDLSDGPDGTTVMDWIADVHIHGKLASVGARLIEGTAKKMIEQTFDCMRAKLEA